MAPPPSTRGAVDYPGPFFHVAVADGDKAKEETNLSAEAVVERVAVPYRMNAIFRVDGVEFRAARVKRLRITRSDTRHNPAALFKQLDTSSLTSALLSMAEIGQKLSEGEDVTDDMLKLGAQVIAERGLTPPKTGAFDVPVVPDKAFVVMSFAPELNQNYEAIATACAGYGIKAVRSDQEISSQAVIERVITHLKEASYVIGDLTNARPNVYYEIGYFDAICAARDVDASRHLLLVASDVNADTHFDLRHRGVEEYDNPFTLMKRVTAWLDSLGLSKK